MNCVIVYWSRFGNGKRIVERLAEKLKEKGDAKVLTISEANPKAMPAADVYIFSAPAEAFGLQRDMKAFLKSLSGMEGKKYGIMNTHAMKKSRLPKMESILTKKGMLKVVEIEFQVVGDTKGGNGLPEGWEAKVDEFVGKLDK